MWIAKQRVDKSWNGFSPKDSVEKHPKPFQLFNDAKVEMWFSPKDSHARKVEIQNFAFVTDELLKHKLSLPLQSTMKT